MFDKNILIIGASKGLGKALSENLSVRNNLILSSRNSVELEILHKQISKDSAQRHFVLPVDLSTSSSASLIDYVDKCFELLPEIDLCIITAGAVSKQDTIENRNLNGWDELITTNYTSLAKIIHLAAGKMLEKNGGKIWVCSSISIFAPRNKNMIYGSSKSALDYFCRAIQKSLFNTNVHIGVIRLGYLQTDMTKGKKLRLPVESSHKAAKQLIKIFQTSNKIVYLPSFWLVITFAIRILPQFIYQRLNIKS